MVSQTALTCRRYAAGCTKTKAKILRPEKGETGCVLGAEGDGNGCEQVRTDGKNRKSRRKSWDGLVSAAASVGSRQSATGARSPLGTRFWSGCGRAHQGAEKGSVSPGSRRKPQKGRCWFGAASYFWRRIVYRLPLLPSKEKHLRQEDGQADQDHGRVGPGGI